ncbi:GntR family transcriptional regulator [Nesterenkonia sandarakina]|uniref:GntR family transcriptional regulator n=1 Tax=Nesterenkonia sandarakina TaxID=272918 RepID=A0A2T0YA79_9MICC|nr:GntR family transcriptional regulator [Nesterenkonia sandarakina]PRZ11609.1 GntR family transcriptional regulator [Nesterenkonia sandarakina]
MKPTIAPVAERKLSSHMYRELEDAIVDCSFPPGTPLSDRELAVQFNVSRTPVRDTLHLLQVSGLVERGQRTGWVVTQIGTQDVKELYELRSLLEPAGLDRIVEWGEKELQHVGTLFDDFDMPVSGDDVERYLVRDDEFHQLIIKATENSQLIRAYRVVDRQLARCKRFVSYQDNLRREESLREHRAVCHALAERNLDAARIALLDHIYQAKNALMGAITASASMST